MPELGPMMRALELQRLIEDKVTEWRERSARVAGAGSGSAGARVPDSYHQPLNFKRHTNRRKNSAEINRIIAKYSKPNRRSDERYVLSQKTLEIAPSRPARHKKSNINLSKSEDNLANMSMDVCADPAAEVQPPPRLRRRSIMAKYNAKSYEDITAFVDIDHSRKSQNFEENSILNAKTIKPDIRPRLYRIGEDKDIYKFSDNNGLVVRNKSEFATSTPLSKRKTCPVGDSVSVSGFELCANYVNNMRKGASQPDLLSVDSQDLDSVTSSKMKESKKQWKRFKVTIRNIWPTKKAKPKKDKS